MAGGFGNTLKRIIDNCYALWAVLALPGLGLLVHDALNQTSHGPYLRLTGLYSCWLLLVALAVTPLGSLLGPQAWICWLKARRRYLGVACFGYAMLHLLYYAKENSIAKILGTFTRPDILAGWLGLAILLAMALTSHDYAVRAMGPRWKQLQRLVYPGAVLTAAHWVFAGSPREALLYILPVALLTIYRIARIQARRTSG